MAIIKEFKSNKTHVKCSESIHLIRVAAVRHTWLLPVISSCIFSGSLYYPAIARGSTSLWSKCEFVCVLAQNAFISLHPPKSTVNSLLGLCQAACTGSQTRVPAHSGAIKRNTLTSCNKHTVSYWTMARVRHSCYQCGCGGERGKWVRQKREKLTEGQDVLITVIVWSHSH